MRNSVVAEITRQAEKNESIYLLTGDLGFNVLNVFWDKFPDRFINCGISEQNMTAVAAGMGLDGKCVFTYSIGNFPTLRCLEQIRNDICYPKANVKIIGLGSGFAYGDLGMSHHATEDIACMRSLPNMTVFSPCDPLEAIAAVKAAVQIDGPCYIRIGRGKEPCLRDAFDSLEVGKGYCLFSGSQIAILSTGAITAEAKHACEILKAEGIEVSLFDFPTIKPIDDKLISDLAKTNHHLISLEEGNVFGGFGGAVAEVLSEIEGEHAVLKRMGLQDEFTSIVGDTEHLRHYYKMDAQAIVKAVKELWKSELL